MDPPDQCLAGFWVESSAMKALVREMGYAVLDVEGNDPAGYAGTKTTVASAWYGPTCLPVCIHGSPTRHINPTRQHR